MVITSQVKDILRTRSPMSVDEIAEAIMVSTENACDTADVMDALDLLIAAGEVSKNGLGYSLV